MAGMRDNITWPRALLWSAAAGALVAAMFAGVLIGWKSFHPDDPFLASLGRWEVGGFLGAIFAATFGTFFYWFTFLLADRRAARAARREEGGGKPPV